MRIQVHGAGGKRGIWFFGGFDMMRGQGQRFVMVVKVKHHGGIVRGGTGAVISMEWMEVNGSADDMDACGFELMEMVMKWRCCWNC